jgi:hypothetical protein
MHMAVDPSRQNELAAGIDDLTGGAKIVAQRRDNSVLYSDVAAERVGSGRDGAAANDRVECSQRKRASQLPR